MTLVMRGVGYCLLPKERPANSLSNKLSRTGETPRIASTTCFAQLKYSALRSSDQLTTGDRLISRTLQILSASFTSFACSLSVAACSI
jgi:hypothetical protein